MAINFPTSPSTNDVYTQDNLSWQFNGEAWDSLSQTAKASSVEYTPAGTGAEITDVQSKIRETISVTDFGAVGDGVVDDASAIQAAIDYAESITTEVTTNFANDSKLVNYVEVDLLGREFAIASGLYIDKSIKFSNGRLLALPTFSSNNGFMLEIRDGADHCFISNIFFDGGLTEVTPSTPSPSQGTPGTAGTFTRHADIIWVKERHCRIVDCSGAHFPNYGIRVGDTSSNDFQFAKQNILERCSFDEWLYSEDGREYPSLKTARGYSIEAYQTNLYECSAGQALHPIYFDSSSCYVSKLQTFNGQDSTDNGGILTDNQIGVYHNKGRNIFESCVFGSGHFHINNVNQGSSKPTKATISNCELFTYGGAVQDSHIYIETDEVDDDCDGLIVTNTRFGNISTIPPISFNTTGSGSFVDDIDKKIHWVGNIFDLDGTSAWVDAKFGAGNIINNGEFGIAQPSITGTVTFTNTDNKIAISNALDLLNAGANIGDVISISGSTNNDTEYTIEAADPTYFIVNSAHAGGTTSKSLTDEAGATNVTITLEAKANVAQLGYGQGWVATNYGTGLQTNSTGRTIVYNVRNGGSNQLNVDVDGVQIIVVSSEGGGIAGTGTAIIPNGSTYQRNQNSSVGSQYSLR